jgi:hypothetical protein
VAHFIGDSRLPAFRKSSVRNECPADDWFEEPHSKLEKETEMNKEQITETINELSGYLASAQKVVENYQLQISELEERRAQLLDARFKSVFGHESVSGQ